MKRIFWIIAVLAFAASCSRGGGISGDYVAKVGNVKLTKEDVKAAVDSLPITTKQVFQGPDGTARFVAEMARREALYQEAKKRGLEKNKDVQRRLEEARKNTLAGILIQKDVEDASRFDEKDMKAYYEAHKDEFIRRDEVRASQIVVKTPEEAQKIVNRLKAGEDFAKVAAALSLDKATAKSGGDMGVIGKNSPIAPALMLEIMGTKKGELGRPVTLPDGVHIVKVTGAKGTPAGYEEVKNTIFQRMTGEKRRAAMDKLLEGVRKDYKIDINQTAVAKLPPIMTPNAGNKLPPGHPAMP